MPTERLHVSHMTEINRQRRIAGRPMMNLAGFRAAETAHREDDSTTPLVDYALAYVITSSLMADHSSAQQTPTEHPNADHIGAADQEGVHGQPATDASGPDTDGPG